MIHSVTPRVEIPGDGEENESLSLICKPPDANNMSAGAFLEVELRLNADLDQLRFGPPVRYVYRPLRYAWGTHQAFVQRFCRRGQSVLFLGMNPGPFGMAQTGVRMCIYISSIIHRIIQCFAGISQDT